MNLRLETVQVASRDDDTDGRLVFAGDFLVAMLVRLSDLHGEVSGRWFLEAGFGPALTLVDPPTFGDLDEAQAWITQQLSRTSVAQVS